MIVKAVALAATLNQTVPFKIQGTPGGEIERMAWGEDTGETPPHHHQISPRWPPPGFLSLYY